MGGPNRPSIVDKIPTVRRGRFIDHSNSGIETPEISLLLAASRFSKSIRWSLIGREIANRPRQAATNTPFASPWPNILEYFALAFASICRLMPGRLRIGIYQSLKSSGVRTYGPSSSLKVQQLPFGMYLKTTHCDDYQALANEFGALKLVRDQTQVPVPRQLLGSYIDVLSDDDLDIFKRDMQKYMAQLRIVDWENSGWFPYYWECTKAHYVTKLNKRWLAVVDEVFETFGDFKLDLAIERRLWEYCF
ncbi:hypothetical protein FPRO05_06249 [Fusarium proliferatum]|uniref:Uncharacterized protein n=1 Tax=Gibberella intermedia TaxID=948311 RepID=A0A365MP10_GIBIN|nr:hypothetical protein FPRO05_06249 [Fusarium proliferatum]